MGFVSVNGFMIPDTDSKVVQDNQKRCQTRCDILKDDKAKKICILKCSIQTQQRVILIIRRSAAKATSNEAKLKFNNDIKRAQVRLLQYKKQLTQASAAPVPKAGGAAIK